MQLMNLNFKRSIAPPRMRHEKLAPFKKRSVACQNVSSTFDNEVNEKIRNPQKDARNTNIFFLNHITRSGQSVLGPDDTIQKYLSSTTMYPPETEVRPNDPI